VKVVFEKNHGPHFHFSHDVKIQQVVRIDNFVVELVQ
jgi:hypothetical protein